MRNTSDMIEKYLKELLTQAAEIEIRRSELAANFGVVPSQINYVIKTRFTLPKGFEVESKRGGGGYIRIVRIQYSDEHEFLMDLLNKIPEKLTITLLRDLLQLLFNENILAEREGNLFLATLSSPVLTDLQRAILLTTLVQGLDKCSND
ncbi:CtsR family transcriptional regulator [Pseudolactococcus plantarum]|uniref:Transcriptional regulator CtsR n=1 Tax=Pseudolactococcus plantarum TaxID=1365 RepID=A0A2A5S2G9_9LACT|nr:CtsR family transcriptional regulator [Lactococcus plantarum]PCS07640.1 CtsR family transcriptional regulator [Lactococcus plantarum]HCN75062.1 CtsR family transcriptional regulator [Lactococcus sp.]